MEKVQYENALHQLLIDRSIFVDLLCCLGGCAHYNDSGYQQSIYKQIKRLNF